MEERAWRSIFGLPPRFDRRLNSQSGRDRRKGMRDGGRGPSCAGAIPATFSSRRLSAWQIAKQRR